MISKVLLFLGTINYLCLQSWADPILGTSYASQKGTKSSGTTVTHFDNGDFMTYASVNFDEPGTTKGIKLNYARDKNGGNVEIRLGGTTGTIIAEISPASTKGWSNYQTAYIGIDNVDGVHDVTIVGRGTSGLMNLAWFELSDFGDRAVANARINAYEYSNQKGVQFGSSKNMGYFDNGDYITYSHINFGTSGTTDGIRIHYGKGNSGGKMEVRLGGPTGAIIAEISPAKTGSWGTYVDASIDINGVNGVHDLTLVGRNKSGVLNLAWFELY